MINSLRSKLYGQRRRRAKLSESDVLAARIRFARGETCESIAADYPVVPRVMQRIVTGITYRHVPMPGPEERRDG